MATVVSKGMKWSPEALQKAQESHQYIKVGPKPGFLVLSGAPNRWKKPESRGEVYVPSLRVAGQPAAIRQLFTSLGFGNVIDQHLAAAYTAENIGTTMAGQFEQETEQYRTHKQGRDAQKKTTGPDVSLADLSYFVEELPRATTVARTATSPRAAGATSPRVGGGRGRVGRVEPLAKRLADARAKGKVLDVSKMDVNKGTGIKMIARPGANSKKVGVEGLEIVSSDPALYAAAVRQLGANFEPFVGQYQAQAGRAKQLAAPAVAQAVLPPPVVTPTFQAPRATTPRARTPTNGGNGGLGGLPTFTVPGGLGGNGGLPTVPGQLPGGFLPQTTLPVGTPPGSPRGLPRL